MRKAAPMQSLRLLPRPLRAAPTCQCRSPIRRAGRCVWEEKRRHEYVPSNRRDFSAAPAPVPSVSLSDQQPPALNASTSDDRARLYEEIAQGMKCFQIHKARNYPSLSFEGKREVTRSIAQSRRQWDLLLAQHANASEAELQQLASDFDFWRGRMTAMLTGVKVPLQPIRLGQYIRAGETVLDIRQRWEALQVDTRKRIWARFMFSAMIYTPQKLPMLLEATMSNDVPGYVIDSVLFFIAKARMYPGGMAHWEVRRVLDLLFRVLREIPPERLYLQQRTILTFIERLHPAQVTELYDALREGDHHIKADTLLHIIKKLSQSLSHRAEAFSIMKDRVLDKKQQMLNGELDLQEPKCASVITSLMSASHEYSTPAEDAKHFSPTDALEFFMEQGFQPNIITLTALLRNIGLQGEVDEAFRLAQTFAEAGIKFDKTATNALFNIAKVNLRPDKIATAIEFATVAQVPESDTLGNVLHAVFYFSTYHLSGCSVDPQRNGSYKPLFMTLLRLYVKRFDLWQLQQWIPEMLPLLLDSNQPDSSALAHDLQWAHALDPRQASLLSAMLSAAEDAFSRRTDTLLQPDIATLNTLLRTYIGGIANREEMLSFSQSFKSKIEELPEDSLVQHIHANQDTVLYDTMLLSMIGIGGMIGAALDLFGNMFSHERQNSGMRGVRRAPKSALKKQPDAGLTAHPPPTITSYSIMLKGLFSNHENQLAQEVIALMQKSGVRFNLPTYNTILKGFALAQNMSKSVETLQVLEDAGFKANDATLKAFSKLRNQRQALAKMEEIIESNRKSIQAGLLEYYG